MKANTCFVASSEKGKKSFLLQVDAGWSSDGQRAAITLTLLPPMGPAKSVPYHQPYSVILEMPLKEGV
jgi:hypothetical protein